MQFDVREDGRTDEIEVIDRIGHEIFERAAVDSVSRWRYAPVTEAGIAVRSRGLRVAIPFKLDVQAAGATPKAKQGLEAALAAMRSRDLEGARQILVQLDAWEWPNLYETQYRSFVRGLVLHLDDQNEASIAALQRALLFDGKYIREVDRRRALSFLVRAAYLADKPGEADRALSALELAVGAERLPSDLRQIRDLLEERRRHSEPIRYEIEIPPRSTPTRAAMAQHTPLQAVVRFETAGESFPRRLGILCDEHKEMLDAEPGMEIEIDDAWENCTLQVYGTPGTRLTILELPIS